MFISGEWFESIASLAKLGAKFTLTVAYFDPKLTLIVAQDSSYLLLVLTCTFRSKMLGVSSGYGPGQQVKDTNIHDTSWLSIVHG